VSFLLLFFFFSVLLFGELSFHLGHFSLLFMLPFKILDGLVWVA
jgi:hypothetical protein